MNDNDKQAFKDLMDGVAEMYNPDKKLSAIALKLYFGALQPYSLEQVSYAISSHVVDPSHGTFFPKAADIVRKIEGGDLTQDQIISAARIADTPLGILCRIQIGTFDLDNQKDMFYLRQRAQECLDKMPEWKARAVAGDYTDHEIAIMLKWEVDPTKPFSTGLCAPQNAEKLLVRSSTIEQSSRYLAVTQEPHEHDKNEESQTVHESVRAKLIEMFADDEGGDIKQLFDE
jgi:hypothetical protein